MDQTSSSTRGSGTAAAKLILERLRSLTFGNDRSAALIEATVLLDSVSVGPGLDADTKIRLDAHRHIYAFDQTRNLSTSATADTPMRAIIQINELFYRTARVDVGAAVVNAYRAVWPNHEALRTLSVMTRGIGEPDLLFCDDASLDLQVVRKPGASATIIVFCGVNHGFGISISILYHFWLSGLNANIIFLRDFEGILYLGGLRSIGDCATTLSHLKELVKDLGGVHLASLGFSAGNFGALYYGVKLNANRVVAFAGPTSIEIGLEFPNKQSYPKVKALHEQGKVPWPNLRELIGITPETTVRCFYSEENVADRKQAENLRGLGNATITPLHGSSAHFTLEKLAIEGLLEGILREAAGLPVVVGEACTALEPMREV